MRFITVILIILISSSLQAQNSEIIQFNNGEIADADDVNSNFNNLDDRVKALEADNAVSTSCSQSDMNGKWSIVIGADPSESTLCLAYFEGSTWFADQSSSTNYNNDGSQETAKPQSANFSVDSDCKITILLNSGDGSSEIGEGWMGKGGSTFNGITQNSVDNIVLTWSGIKLD